ncbi:hypothetical protein [Desulfocurvus sp. DL9XJH121]
MLRFKDINILPKQLGVMGVVLALMVLNISFGHMGVNRMSDSLEVFSRWSDIDMVMNEAVTQNLLLTVGAVNNYSALPSAERYARFEQAQQEPGAGSRNGRKPWPGGTTSCVRPRRSLRSTTAWKPPCRP